MSALGFSALEYASRGWRVFPLTPRDKIPLIARADGGKGCHDATTDDAQVATWWATTPQANIGLHCGPASGVFVVDVDVDLDAGKDGERDLATLEAKHGALPPTLAARTGSGGRHLFFRYPEGRSIRNRVAIRVDGVKLDGLDVRSEGGYVVLAPSVHPKGTPYEWLNQHEIAEAPAWLVEVLDPPLAPPAPFTPPPVESVDRERRYCEAALKHACERICALHDGRRAALIREGYTIGGYVGAGLLDFGAAFRALCDAGTASGTKHDVAKHVGYALQTGSEHPRRPPQRSEPDRPWVPGEPGEAPWDNWKEVYHSTDLGNAKRFVALHGENVRYCSHLKGEGFLIWNGARWVLDETGDVMRLARQVPIAIAQDAAALEAEAAACEDEQERAELEEIAEDVLRWSRASENLNRLRALVELVKSEPGIAISPVELDACPWLLNCTNGVVNLKTGEFREHRRSDLLTVTTGVPYEAGAKCPEFGAFLLKIMGGDLELVGFLRRAVGYSLVGNTAEQIILILYGSGANGKSTFVNAVRRAFGGFARTTSTETFLSKREGGIPNDLAALAGVRFVCASEVGDGRHLDEALVKQVTGSEVVSVRFLNREWFEYLPQFTVWLSTNHKPIIKGTDHGIWRRLRLVPFAVTIPEAEQDQDLARRLADEAPGILAWAVQGCEEWREYGMKPPAKILDATAEYRTEMDLVGHFLQECCVVDKQREVPNPELFAAFVNWLRGMGERERSQRWFSRQLKDRGFDQYTPSGKGRHWKGVALTAAQMAAASSFYVDSPYHD